MSLGENLAFHRKRIGLSQADLAEVLDVSRQAISKWEQDISVPSGENLIRLRELFGVSIDEMIDDIRDAKPKAPPRPPAPSAQQSAKRRGPALWLLGTVCAVVLAVLLTAFILTRDTGAELVDQSDLPIDIVDLTSAEHFDPTPIEE